MTENGYIYKASANAGGFRQILSISSPHVLSNWRNSFVSGFYTTMSWSLLGRITDKISMEFYSSRIYMLYQSDLWKSVGATWAIVWFCTFLFLRSVIFTSRRFFKDKYPPGPSALPFVGNLFQLSADAWVPFTKWKSTYGERFLEVSCNYALKLVIIDYFRPCRISQRCRTAGYRSQHPQGRLRSSR
jgi:hypothetical protein